MIRLLPFFIFVFSVAAQVRPVPNTTTPRFRAILNDNLLWLDANKAKPGACPSGMFVVETLTTGVRCVGLTQSMLINVLGFMPAQLDHTHDGVYEPIDTTILRQADLEGTGIANTPARSDHTHDGVYEPIDTTILRQANLAGTGTANTPARSDHRHDGVYEPVDPTIVRTDAQGNLEIGATLPDAALGGVLGGWNKYTVTFANNAFKTADTAVSIVLGELPANGRIEELVVDHAAFAGTGITSFTCSLGDGTNHTIYAPALNLLAAAGTSVTHQDGGSFSALKAAHNLTLRCTANANVGDGEATVLTAGRLDIWLKVSVLQ